MAFDVAAARAAGYSEQEIADYLGTQSKFDTGAAIKAGYTPADIISHLQGAEKPKTTVAGHAKEFVKGVLPGAVGMLESAATGAAAMLPEDMEKAAREKIAAAAAAAKKPFEAAPGYEEAVSRKFGEAMGSTVPFFALGPAGLAGRVAAGGLGVAAGAGEARTAAEAKGATGQERALATALGAPTGLLDIIAPEIKAFKGVLTTALARGGVEGATEAAQKIAQNLIAKGVYDPKQDVLAGSGEEGAYGAGAGALTSLILDLALPGRQRGVPAAPGRTPPPAPAAAPEGQGEMFTPAEMGVGKAPAAAAIPSPAAEPAAPAGEQADLGLDYQREVEQLYLERERLKQAEQTAEVKQRVADLSEQITSYEEMSIAERRAQQEADEARAREEALAAERFPALANAPALMAQSDEVKARTQGELFPGEDLGVAPPAGPVKEPTLRQPKETGPRQVPLGLRRNPEGQPTTFGQPEPTITSEDVMMTAVPVRKGMEEWIDKNIIGSTRTQLTDLVTRNPELIRGNDQRAKLLRALTLAEVPAFEEKPSAQTRAEKPAPQPRAKPGPGESRLEVPGEPAAAELPEPGAGVARPTGRAEKPVGRRLVPAGRPAESGAQAQGVQPTAVTPQATLQSQLQEIIDDPTASKRSKQTAFTALDALQDPTLNETQSEREYNEADAAKALASAQAQRHRQFAVDQGAESAVPAAPASPEMLKAVDGRPMLEAAQWAAQNLPDPDQRVIAQRVLVKLRQLQELGAELKPIKVTGEGRSITSGAKGATQYTRSRTGGKSSIEVWLNHPSNGAQSGVTPEVLLHELLHAATMGTIDMGKLVSAEGTKAGTAARELLALAHTVVRHFNSRVASGAELTPFEQRVLKRNVNALQDSHELLVWSLTNREMQQYMESIPYKGQTAWNQFVTFVRDLLGIPAKADTALSEALRVGDTLLSLTKEDLKGAETQTGVQFQVSNDTESLIDSMGALDPEQKKGLTALVQSFKAGTSPAEPDYATKFRTQTADAAATIEHRLREQFDGAVRDSLGKLNPMGLYRQAQDYTKALLEYFQVGGLIKDTSTGLWVVQDVQGVRPPAEVYKLIDAWGAKNGYDRERATRIASRVLEGVRLDAMRTANKTEGTNFLLHLKDAEIDQLVAEYKADPDLQAMSAAMDESRKAMVDNMVATGRLTAEQGQQWKEVSGYVPFDRIDDFATSFTKVKKVSNKGIAQVGKLPELTGSLNRPVGNVFDNYLNTLGWMVGQTMKTDATVQTLRSLEKTLTGPQAKFLGRSTQQKANTVGAYVNGEMMYWELPSKYDVLAFKDLNPPKAGWLRNLGKFSNVLRKSVTALPPFALKQVTDDVQRAIMTSGVKNPGALLRMSLSNFGGLAFAELRGIQHPAVKQFGRMGLTGEYDFEAGKPATSLLKDLGYKKRGKFETLMHRLDGITRASDLAVRKAIYDQTMKESNDQLLAQTRAREFINFRRRGASDFVGAMVTTIPFFNAYIQGMDVLYRAASGKDSSSSIGRAQARQMFWSRAATVMMLSSLYALGAGDDEDYQEMDLRTRDGNWILPGGVKLPVPGELGALFKVIPERVVEYMRRQGTPEEQTAWEATRTALGYIFEQYVGRTVPVPQAVKPLLEAWTNYSFFTGRELEGIYQKQQDPSMRRAANTSELAIAIANFARDVVGVDKVSPILVDNALNGYFGSSAGLLVATTDSLLNPTRVDRPLHKWALVSNYMYDPVGTRRMTEFYEAREKVGRANATLNELMKTDMDRAAAYAESHASELMLESAVNSTLEQLERTRAYRKYLNSPDAAESMSKEDREAELQELRKMEVGMTSWLREAKQAVGY